MMSLRPHTNTCSLLLKFELSAMDRTRVKPQTLIPNVMILGGGTFGRQLGLGKATRVWLS